MTIFEKIKTKIPVSEANQPLRYYDMEMAQMLEQHMNMPYSKTDGPPCDNCPNKNGFEYKMTGHVIDDGAGMYVEKVCKLCSALTAEGDGDFHSHYRLTEHGIESHEEEISVPAIVPSKSKNITEFRLPLCVASVSWQTDEDGYAVGIYLKESMEELSDGLLWTFGFDNQANDLSVGWYRYIIRKIQDAGYDQERFDTFYDGLVKIDSSFQLAEVEEQRNAHMRDIIKK